MSKIRDIAVLFKMRLTFLVVISAVLGYYLGIQPHHVSVWTPHPYEPTPYTLLWLCLGGFLLTGGSNGLNQVWEKEWDKLMVRTQNRPIPQSRMSRTEGIVLSSIAGVSGVLILWFLINPASGILGLFAFLSYVFVYTPLKRVTSLAVFVGAFPGAIPPMLGYVAASNSFGLESGLLFAMQFMWQFPHFWAIAWVAHDDYTRGGYKLLPYAEGRTKKSAFQILVYSLFLIPVSLLPWAVPPSKPLVGDIAAVVALLGGLVMVWYAFKLYRSCDVKDARSLMFASFFYLPVVQLFYVIDKI